MFLLDKKAYQNARKERGRVLENITLNIDSQDSSTENASRNGFNLQEMGFMIKEELPDDFYLNSAEDSTSIENFDFLKRLSNKLDDKKEANFVSFVFKKISKEINKTPIEKFNDLILKINNADIPDRNDLIKKLTKIFSRAVILESIEKDIVEAQDSAYKKILNRARQYLSNGSMINKSAQAYNSSVIYNNPAILADNIKSIIDVLVSRFSPDARQRAYPNLRGKINNLNPFEIASKRSPGGAAIGAAITLIKNILNGRDAHFISLVIQHLTRIL